MDDLIFEKFDEMEPSKAIELIHSLLVSSNSWERNIKSIEKLILLRDNNHFQEIKNLYTNEMHPNVKIKLIELFNLFYIIQGKQFIKEQYKKENDWRVRKAILKSIESNVNETDIEFLINTLKDSDIEIKKLSISQLGKIGDEKAFRNILNLLRYGNNEIYKNIIESTAKIIKNNELDLIKSYINEDNIYVRRSIPLILKKTDLKTSLDIVSHLLDNEDDIVKINSLKAIYTLLKKDNDNEITKKIIRLLDDKNQNVRYIAIQTLGKLKKKIAVKPLTDLLKQSEPKIRKFVIKALYSILINTKITKTQYQYLENKNINIRAGYITLMGIISDRNSLTYLIKALNSKNSNIRRNASSSIIKISENIIDKVLINGLQSQHWQIRKSIAKILGKIVNIDNNEIITALIPLLQDKNNRVRIAATNSLAGIHNSEIISYAKERLQDSNWRIKRCAVNLLMKIGTQETLKLVTSSINDKDIYIRKWAIRAIGRLGEKDKINLLIEAINDRDQKIRILAIKTLGQLGDKSTIRPLAESLTDINWRIKKESEDALNKIDINWIEYL
ncbi:MAG: HEAT repeat domain-containing protein [Candidatus Lokiarchaeota archaeon]|nr:HEAT repeat domain-containing protein [Candidatus Lokiarchaeota archaeon]